MAKFLSAVVFTFNAQERAEVEQFVMAFPSNLHPIVGQQVTVNPANVNRADVNARLELLEERAGITDPRPECELVAKRAADDGTAFILFFRDGISRARL